MAFRPSDATGYLVDLPGYGYAAAPDGEVEAWQSRTQDFLAERAGEGRLRRLYLLVDARHGAAQFDRAVMGWLDEAGLPYTVVLTKADRVGRPQLVRAANDLCMRYHSQMYGGGLEEGGGSGGGGGGGGCQGPIVHVTSARTGEGIGALKWSIDEEFARAGRGKGDEGGWGGMQQVPLVGAAGGEEDEEYYFAEDDDEDEDEESK